MRWSDLLQNLTTLESIYRMDFLGNVTIYKRFLVDASKEIRSESSNYR